MGHWALGIGYLQLTIHFILKSLRRNGIIIPVSKLDIVTGKQKGISACANNTSSKEPTALAIATF
ncbi:hypothetical protein H6H03_29010 [Nostoc paludosum FACHB-159]|uniref:Uncharacterized protein n=1 Tax=Nostoc paludosum FACHB-159 TaxID=2692908 RepID=A0ABR8KHV3_9NOSO|nr:hypothetical protein [Nostoc paludosum FACHB-159]